MSLGIVDAVDAARRLARRSLRSTAPASAEESPTVPRRSLALGVAGVLAVAPFVVALSAEVGLDADAGCGPGAEVLVESDGTTSCVHFDQVPPGVDVTTKVSTRTLLGRLGAGRRAFRAAEALGVAGAGVPDAGVPEADATATDRPSGAESDWPAVPCDGDGTSGYRVQALYVVEAGQPDRFAALEQSLKIWAAGVDDVINRSAALSGGVRNVRYVTEPGPGGTCQAAVLPVTVPAGATATFSATVNAVKALGYDDPTRKYLMWTDAAVLCGVANLHRDDQPGVGNLNNGARPMYARIDTGCWGLGDAVGQASIEAHELAHTLGGVQSSAPNSTGGGHCTDERDTLCYPDGGQTMRQVCPPEREYLLDCASDDYFATDPQPDTYLATHWNAANSRFLINGGAVDPSATLGASLGVNSPAVPGLATQASVTPHLPNGRTLRSLRWTSSRPDCTVAEPDALQTEVVCDADATGSSELSVALRDSTGARTEVSQTLQLAADPGRSVEVDLGLRGRLIDPDTVCIEDDHAVVVTVRDATTGLPVAGLTLDVTAETSRGTSTQTVRTDPSGSVALPDQVTSATTYTATTRATASFNTSAPTSRQVHAASCEVTATSTLTGQLDTPAVGHGTPVTVSGMLTHKNGRDAGPVPGVEVVAEVFPSDSAPVILGRARTGADGRYAITAPLEHSGELQIRFPGGDGLPAATRELGPVTAGTWTPWLSLNLTSAGGRHLLQGHLTRQYRLHYEPAVGFALPLWFTPADGSAPRLLDAVPVGTDGSYALTVRKRSLGGGTVTARIEGVPGYREATASADVRVPAKAGGKSGKGSGKKHTKG